MFELNSQIVMFVIRSSDSGHSVECGPRVGCLRRVTMRTAIDSRRTSSKAGRLFGGAALAAFLGAFFVMPLWAALTLCTMPCCHPAAGDTSSPVVTAAMTGCETECSIDAADDVTPTASVVVPTPAHEDGIALAATSVAAVDGTVPAPVVASSSALPMTHGADAPIHVLNSTFRI